MIDGGYMMGTEKSGAFEGRQKGAENSFTTRSHLNHLIYDCKWACCRTKAILQFRFFLTKLCRKFMRHFLKNDARVYSSLYINIMLYYIYYNL